MVPAVLHEEEHGQKDLANLKWESVQSSFGAWTRNVRHSDTGEKIPVPTIVVQLYNLQQTLSTQPYQQSLKLSQPVSYLDFFEIELLTIGPITVSLRKHAYAKYIENFTAKNWKFSDKNSDIFHISAQNIDCGYSLRL